MFTTETTENPDEQNVHLLEQRGVQSNITQGANYFLAVAVMSSVRSLRALSGGYLGSAFGFGIPTLIGEFARIQGYRGIPTAVVIHVCTAGFFVACWYFGVRGSKWAFLAGMSFYLLDALVLLLFREVVSVGVHGWILFKMYEGFSAISWLRRLQQSQIATSGAPIQPR